MNHLLRHTSMLGLPLADLGASLVGGALIYYLSQLRDQRRARRAAPGGTGPEARFRALMESPGVGVVVTDLHANGIQVNPAFLDITGLAEQEALGMGWLNAIHPHDLFRIFDAWTAKGIEAGLDGGEYRVIRRDGEVRWIRVYGSDIPSGNGPGDDERIGIVVDITAERKALAERSAAMRYLEDLRFAIDQSAMVTFADGSGRMIEVNDRFVEVSGYSRAELIGSSLAILRSGVHPPGYFEKVRLTLQQGKVWRGEVCNRAKDGSLFWADMSITPVEAVDGTRNFLAIHVDITARKAAEESTRRAQKMQAVGQLSGGLAHDFNNILGVILGNLGFLERRLGEDREGHRRVESALRAVDRGAAIIRRLLSFARKEAQNPKVTDLNATLESMVDLLERSLTQEVSLHLDLEAGLGYAYLDPGEFENAVLNLAINARDAMPGGGDLRISTWEGAWAPGEGDSRSALFVEVRDSGHGMPKEVVDRIFEPFFSTKEEGKGTGLGLSMVFGFVQRSGGRISVEAQPGRGTRFLLAFPRVASDGRPAGEAEGGVALQRGRGRILVVEDQAELADLARDMLADLGYQAVVGHSVAEALSRLEGEAPFDLVFSDVVMPGGRDGYDLAAEVALRWPGTPVLLTSGYSERIPEAARWTPGLFVLPKPYTPEALSARIRQAMEEGRLRPAPELPSR